MKARLLALAMMILALLTASPEFADATILIPKNLQQLSSESERIVLARVENQHCDWLKDTRVIFTYTKIKVEKTMKGSHESTMEIAEVGGTIGDLTTRVASMPRFKTGERIVLFLKKDGLQQWRVRGAIQGRFSVLYNRATDEDLVTFDAGLAHVTNKYFATKRDPKPRHVSLEEFEDKIKELVVAAKKKEQKK